jgi:ribosomal protein L28
VKIPENFEDRSARTKAVKELAEVLGTTVKEINRLKICNKPLKSVEKRAKLEKSVEEHREKCAYYAKMVVSKRISMKSAAISCDICYRQMARHVTKYLAEKDKNENV